MKLSYITIMVRDMEKTIDFYEKALGLSIVRRLSPNGGDIVFMADSKEAVMLEFIRFDGAPKAEVKGLVMSYSSNGPLEETRARLAGLGHEVSGIVDAPPKPRHFTLKDPDGICVEITE